MSEEQDDKRTTGFFFSARHQWDSLNPFTRLNWRDFTIVKVEGEWSQHTGTIEFTVCVLGLGFEVSYIYDDSFHREIMRRRDEVLAHPERLIPFDEALRRLNEEPAAAPSEERTP